MEDTARTVAASDYEAMKDKAREFGFLDVKAARVAPVKCAGSVRAWIDQNHHAHMQWFVRNLDRRLDPRAIMQDATHILAFVVPYHAAACRLGGYRLARYACGDDYHDVLQERLHRLWSWLQERYPAGKARCYVDTGPVLERYWAAQAGLGFIGKNGSLIVPRVGSYVFLACMLTNLTFPCGTPVPPACGTCRACLDACPTGALVAPGVVDANRCISYLTIEHRAPFGPDIDLEGWVFGCDVCQEVCPWNLKFGGSRPIPEFLPRAAYATLQAQDLARMEGAEFSLMFRNSPIKRAKCSGIQRNITCLDQKRAR